MSGLLDIGPFSLQISVEISQGTGTTTSRSAVPGSTQLLVSTMVARGAQGAKYTASFLNANRYPANVEIELLATHNLLSFPGAGSVTRCPATIPGGLRPGGLTDKWKNAFPVDILFDHAGNGGPGTEVLTMAIKYQERYCRWSGYITVPFPVRISVE
jgi:hypothetical protein